MLAQQLLALLSVLPLIQAETVLGIYVFHRHGDRTSKSTPNTSLTDLGYAEVYSSGQFYRSRYVDGNATSQIFGISADLANLNQLNIQAPVDTVLQNSAAGFLQGLYPPVGATLGSQVLGNGSSVEAPMGGFQLIPVNIVASASTSSAESSTWLQGSSGCENAIVSSNNYFSSAEYAAINNSTSSFYQSLLPVISGVFTAATDTFKNAYTIFDYVYVSTIHNQTIPSGNLLTNETMFQLQTRADNHEFNLAYNASEPVRAIQGATLAAQILAQMNTTITGQSAQPIGIQFGAYASFLSFFGLAQLPAASVNFTGLNGYASAMLFEIVTNATVTSTSYPSVDDISVRFLFSNGSAAYAEYPLNVYPLFGQNETLLPWTTFASEMNKFAIGTQSAWCTACGNSTGVCADATAASATPSASASPTSSKSGGMSKAVAGVIGAMVTLAVVLGIEALIMLVAGLRLVSKSSAGIASPQSASAGVKA